MVQTYSITNTIHIKNNRFVWKTLRENALQTEVLIIYSSYTVHIYQCWKVRLHQLQWKKEKWQSFFLLPTLIYSLEGSGFTCRIGITWLLQMLVVRAYLLFKLPELVSWKNHVAGLFISSADHHHTALKKTPEHLLNIYNYLLEYACVTGLIMWFTEGLFIKYKAE